jgi:hypothetical protein
MDVAEAVRLLDGEDHLGDVEPREALVKGITLNQEIEQVA